MRAGFLDDALDALRRGRKGWRYTCIMAKDEKIIVKRLKPWLVEIERTRDPKVPVYRTDAGYPTEQSRLAT